MSVNEDVLAAKRQRHEQMLKLVAKGFYNELINYGVAKNEILTVAGHLLDNIMQKDVTAHRTADFYNRLFTLKDIRDEWTTRRCLAVHHVSIEPLVPACLALAAGWLKNPSIAGQFHPPFPSADAELAAYFAQPQRDYFLIRHEQQPVGLIGGENLDRDARKLEMRKLVGTSNLQGKGIGKRATFLFLYYVFRVLEFHKVYLHSTDINIRNLNLNSKFGFELEGVFLEEAVLGGRKQDLVRMGLRAPVWLALFS